jgi:predicted Zn-dependent peptidase
VSARRPRRLPAEIRRTEYASGLRVVSERMPEMRSVAMGIWVGVGSRDERPNVAGASHFLEHLLFKGTRTLSARDIAEAFDAVGGDLNAFTSKESTCYYCRVSDRDLPMAVEYMSDMLQHSVLAKKHFEDERQVILEEISMRDDDPGDLVHDQFVETVWRDHPLGRPVLGTRDTIAGMNRDQVKRFYDRLYVPGHFVVAAAGNLDHEDLCGLLEQAMDTGRRVSGGSKKVRDGGAAPEASSGRLVTVKPTEQAHLVIGTSAYSRKDPERFAFGVVANVLGGGMSSRLFQEVREKRGLVYSIYAFHAMYAETGLFSVYAGTRPSGAHEVLRLTQHELADLAEGGLTEEEVRRAKGHMKGSLVLSLEDTGGRMSRIGRSEISHGEILSVDEVLERIDAVTMDDAVQTAKEVFGRPMALAVVGPFEAESFDAVELGGVGP